MNNQVSIAHLAEKVGISLMPRAGNQDAWCDILQDVEYVPFSYMPESIDFQHSVYADRCDSLDDLSAIVLVDNKPIGVWPMSLSMNDNNLILGAFGSPMLPPLFRASISISACKKLYKNCLDLARAIAEEFHLSKWESCETYHGNTGLSPWYWHALSEANTNLFLRHELFIDMGKSLPEIKKTFRKSYKSLVGKQIEDWSLHTLETPETNIWKQFQKLHESVAGRKTRSEESWNNHLNDIRNGSGLLVYLLNNVGEMEGAGFFNYSRDESIYAVAAYNRNHFDKPVGHVIQYEAIKVLKAKSVKWHRMGMRYLSIDDEDRTDKEISISDFKQGFSSHLFPNILLRHSC